MMEGFIDQITAFIEAQQEAEKEGQQEFTCPLCGGPAMWSRFPYNNHLWCKCRCCGFLMRE